MGANGQISLMQFLNGDTPLGQCFSRLFQVIFDHFRDAGLIPRSTFLPFRFSDGVSDSKLLGFEVFADFWRVSGNLVSEKNSFASCINNPNPVPATCWTVNSKIIILHCFDEYSTPHGLHCASVIASSYIQMIVQCTKLYLNI